MNIPTLLRRLFRRSPKAVPARRARQLRPAVELLDDRILPSINFTSSSSGTWAVDSNTGASRQITSAVPIGMTTGADGTMFGNYSNGTWEYNYASNTMTQLTAGTATALSGASDNSLVASYGWGTWEYANGAWSEVTPGTANQLANAGQGKIFGSFGWGTWASSGGGQWTKLTDGQATAMAASSDGTLDASYPWGTYQNKNGQWSLMTPAVANQLAAVDQNHVFGSFPGLGTCESVGGTLNQLTPATPSVMQVGADGSLLGNFGYGVWQYLNGWKHELNDNHLPLAGQVTGTWTSTSNADGSTTQTLTGTGMLPSLGSVQASATLTIPAASTGTDSSQSAVETGTLTLTTSQGTLTLSLTAQPAQTPPGTPGSSPSTSTAATDQTGSTSGQTGQSGGQMLPPAPANPAQKFSYTVTAGTGAYASATGSGTIILMELPGFTPPAGTGTATSLPTIAPMFSMLFSPGISVTQTTTNGQLTLAGQVSGSYTTTANADGSSSQALTGSGMVQPLGSVQATGTVSVPASTTQGGQETATITLTGAQGTITLSLTPPSASQQTAYLGSSGQGSQATEPNPATPFTYTITGGTGAYASATGSGTVILLEMPQLPAPPAGSSGTSGSQTLTTPMFTLIFLPGPV
jgi:hypothetical protein